MKQLLSLSFALLLVLSAQAQKNYKRVHNDMLDQAKALLQAGEYEEATKIYRKLLPLDTTFAEVHYEMGLCLVNLAGRRDEAVPHLERSVRHGHTEAHLELAHLRHRQMRFDESERLYQRYKQLAPRVVKDQEVDRRIGMVREARDRVKHPVEAVIRNMGPGINSSAHDYCPLVTADGNTLYFTSRRQGSIGGLRDPSGQYFEDIYSARRVGGIWQPAENAGTSLNTRVHDATVGLNPDGSSMIIYRTQANLVSGDLYETRLHAGRWQEPELMTERINSKHHEPSASIAPGGDEIYFSSDRPGGYGGRDLYRIRRLPNGQWSLPLNLGPTINSAHDEDAPFVHSDGVTLFFSSNGHSTMGGFDIFKSTLVDPDMNGWSIPENMGYPVNTVNDDIYFCLAADGLTGWFSSERPGGQGLQDIYQVDFPGSQLEYLLVRGLVTDAGEEPVKARITVVDPKADEIVGVYNSSDRTGRYVMVLVPGQHYTMRVEAPGFATQESRFQARSADGSRELAMDFTLRPGNPTALNE